MKQYSPGISITIVGILVGIIGIFTPIGWDLWNSQSDISLEARQSITILKKEESIHKLEIFFGGKAISSLTQTTLVIKNTGRTPIAKEDVVAPLTIRFGKAEILEVTLSRQSPANLDAIFTVAQNVVSLEFQLLNPGDEIELSALTTAQIPTITADARIKNIKQVSVTLETSKTWWKVGFGPYVAGIFGLLFLLVGFGLAIEIPVKKKAKRSLLDPYGPIYQATDKEDLVMYAANNLSFLAGSNKTSVWDLLAKIPDTLTEDYRSMVHETMLKSVENEHPLFSSLLAFSFAGIGIWYAATNFLGI